MWSEGREFGEMRRTMGMNKHCNEEEEGEEGEEEQVNVMMSESVL